MHCMNVCEWRPTAKCFEWSSRLEKRYTNTDHLPFHHSTHKSHHNMSRQEKGWSLITGQQHPVKGRKALTDPSKEFEKSGLVYFNIPSDRKKKIHYPVSSCYKPSTSPETPINVITLPGLFFLFKTALLPPPR